MKLLLEFANKVRSLFHPLYRWVWQKKKKKRETIVTMETTIQFRFSFLPRVSMGSLTCHGLPTFWRAGQKLVFAGFWARIRYSEEIRLPVAKVSFTQRTRNRHVTPPPSAHLGIRLVEEWRSWELRSRASSQNIFSDIQHHNMHTHI